MRTEGNTVVVSNRLPLTIEPENDDTALSTPKQRRAHSNLGLHHVGTAVESGSVAPQQKTLLH